MEQGAIHPAQTAAILARGNIAIHVRLKGEMSEACLGLEPKGWAYVSSLIKDGRATGVNVYIDEPYPQVAESPPVVGLVVFAVLAVQIAEVRAVSGARSSSSVVLARPVCPGSC